MKKYLLVISAVILSLVSCTKTEINEPANGLTMVQLQIGTDESQTRAEGSKSYAVEAYSDRNYTEPAMVFDSGKSSSIESESNTIGMVINPAQEYYFLIWASDGETYNTEDLTNVSIVDGCEAFTEAWQGTFSIVNGSASSYSTTLKRAVSKVNLVEEEEFTASSLTVSFDAYTAFNVAIGNTAGDTANFKSTFEFTSSVTGQLNDEPIYLFAPVEVSDVMDFTCVYGSSSEVLTNIPVQANYITTITGHFEGEGAGNTLMIEIVEDWVAGDSDDDVITIRSIEELVRYITMDNINAKMEPGTYQLTTEIAVASGKIIDEYSDTVAVLVFEGRNSTYDFTDVKFEISTDVLRCLGNHDFYTFSICGTDLYLKNLEVEYIGESYTYDGGAVIVMDGADNTIDGFEVTTRGSYPYGYGDMFGKGSSYTIKHYKHCGILVRGDRPTLINTTVHQYSFGHAIFCQGSVDALIENCYVESELNTTDAVLAETGTAAANIDFLTDWGYRVPAGYAFACCEEGFRAYSTGHVLGTDGSRTTTNTTVRDCSAYQVRGGYVLHFSSGTRLAENCSAIDCETGFGMGNGTATNCVANSNIGLLLVVPYASNSGSTIDINIQSSTHDHIYGEHSLLAYIAGSKHNITFTEDVTEKSDCHDALEIMFGGERTGLRFINSENSTETDNLTATSINFTNDTYYPIAFANNATSNVVTTKGTYTDEGTGNVVTIVE
ncbi:MAG: hypothetical protein SNG38_06005 [Rikenellaceae bacterium]